MARAVRLSDYAGATLFAARREASATLNAIGLFRALRPLGPVPDALTVTPTDLYAADEKRGEAMMDGVFSLAGEVLTAPQDKTIWTVNAPNKAFARHLHGFGWLRDCIAAREPISHDMARHLTDEWIALFGKWNSFSWSPGTLSSRLLNWLCSGDVLFGGDLQDVATRDARFRTVLRQARFLERALPLAQDGSVRLRSAAALALCGICLPGQDRLLKSGVEALARETDRQILPDGGHISRSPRACFEALVDIQTVLRAADKRHVEIPQSVRRAADRLAPMARFFRLSDGGLSSFHGGGEGDREALSAALEADDTDGKPFGFAPHSGYHRATAGGATVVFDVGEAPRGTLSAGAHASALAFELCTPGGRLIVNCGWHDDQSASWREAVRATAAHSTLTLEETSSARLLQSGWRRSLLGPRLATAPGPVTARRNEEDMGVWLEGVHEGYRDLYGLSHRRRIFLAADGGDLRGEDALFRPVSDGPPEDPDARWRFAIRFHLYPSVRASLSRDSMSALLVQPNGDGWRFRTDGGPVKLERSVYLAAGAPPQRSTQIVVYGDAEPSGAGDRPPNRVRWALQRLGRIGGAGGDTL